MSAAICRLPDCSFLLSVLPTHPPVVIREFEAEEAALHEHLTWLVNDAARLKAYYADVMAFTRDMAVEHTIPKGLLEPFPTHVLKV